MSEYKYFDLDALAVIDGLDPVVYTDDGHRRLRLKVSTLRDALPEAIIEYHDETVVDWSAITVITLEAITQLVARVEVLERQLARANKVGV